MRRCAECRAANADDARFCSRCGTRLQGYESPAPERKLVSILFADIVGSTALGSRLDPEHLRDVLDAYVATMREAIEAEGGTVEKFIGDAVMAIFGVPVAHEDDPTRAVRAALGIHRRLDDLNRTLEADHSVRLEVRVGVNTGEVLAVADAPPDESMVTGDAVNVAARLEQAAPAGGVLVSERTARATRGVEFEPVGPLELRGKEGTADVFLAIGGSVGPEPSSDGAAVPMFGRRTELELLRSVWARVVSEGKPARVTIYGEAGVGKTRLVEEIEGVVTRDTPGARVMRGRCLPYGDGVVYWPLADILKRFAGVTDADPSDTATARVEEAVLKLLWGAVRDPERACSALAFTVGLQRTGTTLAGASPARVQAETSAAWCAFFSALAAASPLIAVIEDVHWADPALLDLLEVLADRVEGPALFLCPARPELTARRPDWGGGRWNSSSLLLEPLPAAAADRLLDGLLEVERIDAGASLRQELLERTEGNPFFLEEIVRHVRDRGPGGAVPDTVQAVLAARIDLLGPMDKRVLQSAAVVGKEFWAGAVEQLVARDAEDVRVRLERLVQRGLVRRRTPPERSDEPEYSFRHVLTRDVAYESLPRRDRSTAHASVAEWIEDRAGPRAGEFAEFLAHHYLEAFKGTEDDPRADPAVRETLRSRAFGYSVTASDDARTRLALDAAKGRAEAALRVAAGPRERAEALGALGRARLHATEGDLAWDAFREAATLLIADPGTPDSDVVEACLEALELVTRQVGTMRARLSREEAQPLLDAALEHVTGDEATTTRLRIVRAFWPNSFGGGRGTQAEEEEARRHGEAAATTAAGLGRFDLASAALDGAGLYYMERGRYGDWWPVVQRRLELVDSLFDPMEAGDIFASAAWCAHAIGRYRDAERFATRGVDATIDVEPLMALYCLDWRAVARARLGEWDACLGDVEAAAELLGARRSQPPGYACDHMAAAAFVLDERGWPDEANGLLSIVGWVQREEERPSPGVAVWNARVLARRGRFDEARERLERPEIAEQVHARGQILEAWCDLLVEEEAWDDIDVIVEEARERSGDGGLLALPCHAERAAGMAVLPEAGLAPATASLTAAAEGFDAIGAAWEAARTRVLLADVLASGDDTVGARRALGNARRALEGAASQRELARADAIGARLDSGR